MQCTIREESPSDLAVIHAVHSAAFDTDAEAHLVDALRANGALTLSLVAESDGVIVGHIAFSPVTVTAGERVSDGVGLGPVAVLPSMQRLGIGARLVIEGLRRLRNGDHAFCVVLGHAAYYPRFGFVRASTQGIRWETPVPDDVFFVQELRPGGLTGVSGIVRYRPEFGAV